MNRFLLILATVSVAAVVLAFAPVANSCDALSLGVGHCVQGVQGYSANVQAYSYVAPVVAPVYAPLQTYGYNAPAQAVILPLKVEVTRPQVTYRLEQVQGQSYAAPVVLPLNAYGYSQNLNGSHHQGRQNLQGNHHNQRQNLGAGHHAQNLNGHNQQNFRGHNQQNFNGNDRQSLLGAILNNAQNRQDRRQGNFQGLAANNGSSRSFEFRGPFGGGFRRDVNR